jgi:hypothetical protein
MFVEVSHWIPSWQQGIQSQHVCTIYT